MKWNHHSGLLPNDITRAKAARRVVARWDFSCAGVHDYDVTPTSPAPSQLAQARLSSNGQSCDHVRSPGPTQSVCPELATEDPAHDQDEGSGEEEDCDPERRGRHHQCSAEVMLRVCRTCISTHNQKMNIALSKLEVCADDLSKVRVWQRGTHPDAEEIQLQALQYSRRIRLLMMERMRISGVKVSVLKKGEYMST